jgi:hypothetical protein
MPTATDTPTHATVYALAGLETAELRALISSWTVWRDWFARHAPAIADCYSALLVLAVEVRDARLALLQERLALAHLAATPSDPAAAAGSPPAPPASPALPSAARGPGEADGDADADGDTADLLGEALADLTDSELRALAAWWRRAETQAGPQDRLGAVHATLAAVAADEQAARRRLFDRIAEQVESPVE